MLAVFDQFISQFELSEFFITIHYDDGVRSNKHEISEFTQVVNERAMIP